MKSKLQVSYRDIAKVLVKGMPIDYEEARDIVEDYTQKIEAMPVKTQIALKVAYIFGSKMPKGEQEDMFQELVTRVLEANTSDEALAYTIARCDWINWLDKYHRQQRFLAGSLNKMVVTEDGSKIELIELVVGEVEFERKMDAEIDAQRIWSKLPEKIKPLIQKRLLKQRLTNAERQRLSRYVSQFGWCIDIVKAAKRAGY